MFIDFFNYAVREQGKHIASLVGNIGTPEKAAEPPSDYGDKDWKFWLWILEEIICNMQERDIDANIRAEE